MAESPKHLQQVLFSALRVSFSRSQDAGSTTLFGPAGTTCGLSIPSSRVRTSMIRSTAITAITSPASARSHRPTWSASRRANSNARCSSTASAPQPSTAFQKALYGPTGCGRVTPPWR